MKENKTVQDLFTVTTQETAVAIRPETLTLKRKLTLDATSISRTKQMLCRIDGEFEQIDMPPIAQGAPPSKATAIPITDILTKEAFLLICNSLIVSALKRAGEPLTGKYFAMQDKGIKPGKRYRDVEIMELQVAK